MAKINNLHPVMKIILFLCVMMGVMAIKTSGASAACGVHTNSSGSYAGMIVSSYWQDDGGGYQHANNTFVQVRTYGATMSPPGNVVNLTGANFSTVRHRWAAGEFNQRGLGCPGASAPNGLGDDGVNAVFGYGETSYTSDGSIGPSWALDCDVSVRGGVGNEQHFQVTGAGVPDGARSGGWWDTVEVAPPNGFTTYVAIVYHQPAPPPPQDPGPEGYLDHTSCTNIGGWARDSSNYSRSLQVHVYIDGPAGSGQWGGAYPANVYRGDLGAYYGFEIDIRPFMNTGGPRTFYVYAIGIDGNGNPNGDNPLLWEWSVSRTVQPCVTVSGRVFNADTDAGPGYPLRVELCWGRFAWTDNNGYWSKNDMPTNASYCARVDTNPPNPNVPDVWARGPQAVNNRPGHTNDPGYEYQVSGRDCFNVCGGGEGSWDRSSDNNINFLYRNRSFTVTVNHQPPIYAPSDDAPTSVTFQATSDVSFSPSAGAPSGINSIDIRREFYIKNSSGAIIRYLTPNPVNKAYNISSSGTPLDDETRNVTGVLPGEQICQSITILQRTGLVGRSGNRYPPYTSSAADEECNSVLGKPYFRVYNGDVSSNFDTCTGWGNGSSGTRIMGWNDGSGMGSSTQLAAMALEAIEGFTTATGRTSAPQPAKGLTFANTGPGDAGSTYGGGFSSGSCPSNYFAGSPASSGGGGSFTPAGLPDSSRRNGNVVLTSSGAFGGRKVLYVEGNVFIESNIEFANAWADIASTPSFYLIVKGNIYVHPSVTRLDGIYITQPRDDGTRGEIFTCAFNRGDPRPNSSELNDTGPNGCAKKLTVNGAFIARRVRLMRTNGSLKDSAPGELRGDASIAESFVFSPEMWLVVPDGVRRGGSTNGAYDSITTLPPIL